GGRVVTESRGTASSYTIHCALHLHVPSRFSPRGPTSRRLSPAGTDWHWQDTHGRGYRRNPAREREEPLEDRLWRISNGARSRQARRLATRISGASRNRANAHAATVTGGDQ